LAGFWPKRITEFPLSSRSIHSSRFGPGKREQLAGGYEFSLWVEKTALEMADAVIAVSGETKHDIERLFDVDPARAHVIHNGIDLNQYRKVDSTAALKRYGIDPNKPYLLFVAGSLAKKGSSISYARSISWTAIFRSCFCAAAPDTPGMAEEMKTQSGGQKRSDPESSGSMKWWTKRPPANFTRTQRYSFALQSTNRSAIINLEAMACEDCGGVRAP